MLLLSMLNRRKVMATVVGVASSMVSKQQHQQSHLPLLVPPANAATNIDRDVAAVETKSAAIAFSKAFLPTTDNNIDNNKNQETGAENSNNPLDAIRWDDVPKERNLNTERMSDAINDGLRENEWFVTGIGKPEYFSSNFRFSDPDVSLDGYELYCRQVRRLFDQTTARCEVICCSVTAPNTITVLWRNSGKVNIGPGFDLKPYVVTTTLQTDPNDGLIVSQVDEFESDVLGLLFYQIPFLRPLTSAAPGVDVLRQQCDFYTCKLKTITT